MNIHKKFFSKIGFTYLIYAISAIIIQIIVLNVIGIININFLNNFNALTIISALCNYVLPFPILYYLMKRIETQNIEKQNIGLKTFIVYLSITFTLTWIGNIIGLAITTAIGNVFHTEVTNPVQMLISSADVWLNLLLISIIAPIFEEIIFRKFLIDRTIKYGARISIIMSAVIFGFFHGNLSQLFYTLLLGGFFAYVYIKTGRVIYTITLHIFLNLMGSVLSVFVAESAEALISHAFTTADLAIVGIYILILLLTLLIGIMGLLRYKKAKFNGTKTQIALKNPLKTSLLNPGMILLILFFIGEIVYILIR